MFALLAHMGHLHRIVAVIVVALIVRLRVILEEEGAPWEVAQAEGAADADIAAVCLSLSEIHLKIEKI